MRTQVIAASVALYALLAAAWICQLPAAALAPAMLR